jgi:hypothetical protein
MFGMEAFAKLFRLINKQRLWIEVIVNTRRFVLYYFASLHYTTRLKTAT